MRRLARNLTNGFSTHFFLNIRNSKNKSTYTAATIRKATGCPKAGAMA